LNFNAGEVDWNELDAIWSKNEQETVKYRFLELFVVRVHIRMQSGTEQFLASIYTFWAKPLRFFQHIWAYFAPDDKKNTTLRANTEDLDGSELEAKKILSFSSKLVFSYFAHVYLFLSLLLFIVSWKTKLPSFRILRYIIDTFVVLIWIMLLFQWFLWIDLYLWTTCVWSEKLDNELFV
jgi:hypothetical protein